MTEGSDWFESIWEHREESVYPEIFGSIGVGIYPLTASIFIETFKQDFDPRWLHYGVFESPPCDKHQSWLYVTSGMSNPWEDEQPERDGLSGLGCEFIFETPMQSKWAILRVQHMMAFQVLLAHDRYLNRETLDIYDRIPLHGPITPEPSELTYIMVASPSHFIPSFQLESGHVDLLSLVGITDAEAQFARNNDGGTLLKYLKDNNAFPVTDPGRHCTISQ